MAHFYRIHAVFKHCRSQLTWYYLHMLWNQTLKRGTREKKKKKKALFLFLGS